MTSGSSGAALTAAVETLRSAQIRALREKRAEFPPSEKSSSILRTIDADIDWWRTVPEHVIVDGYVQPTRHRRISSRRMSSPVRNNVG